MTTVKSKKYGRELLDYLSARIDEGNFYVEREDDLIAFITVDGEEDAFVCVLFYDTAIKPFSVIVDKVGVTNYIDDDSLVQMKHLAEQTISSGLPTCQPSKQVKDYWGNYYEYDHELPEEITVRIFDLFGPIREEGDLNDN